MLDASRDCFGSSGNFNKEMTQFSYATLFDVHKISYMVISKKLLFVLQETLKLITF